MGTKATTKSEPVNVALPRKLHTEMRKYADSEGMKLRLLMPELWESFKLRTPEQAQRAKEAARRHRMQAV